MSTADGTAAADAPTLLSSLCSTTLAEPPSCIEFVPGSAEWFVMGTYFLDRAADEAAAAAASVSEDGEEAGEGKRSQKRSGSLVVARLERNGDGGREITITSSHATPFAVFDLHFSPHATANPTASSSSNLLGLASSTGSIALYAIDPSSTSSPITHLRTLQLFPTTTLFTYFSWHPTIPMLAAAAIADGRVILCDCSDDGAAPSKRVVTLHTHALEAWVTAFAPDGGALYSGGDDAALKGVGLPAPTSGGELSASEYLAALRARREDGDEAEEEEDGGNVEEVETDDEAVFTPPWQWHDARTHGAGVTFILPLPSPSATQQSAVSLPQPSPGLLLTGSYDESLRLLSPPASNGLGPRRSRILADVELGGGVWRISVVKSASSPTFPVMQDGEKPICTFTWVLLVSCMHAGTRIVRLTGTAAADAKDEAVSETQWEWEWHFDVLARFEEHQSMNYGSVVQPLLRGSEGEGGGEAGKRTVVSTSFYDRLICVWEF